MFSNKTLLITGGTGSFGHAVLDRFLATDIGEIRIFSRDEKKQDDMRHEYQVKYYDYANKIKFYIGDVRDSGSLNNVMHGVDYLFHAAALKQVPSCEFFPLEAVKTNVIGTENVLTAAINAGVKKIICLSTDKACYPVSAMGISKALMEKIFIAKSRIINSNMLICGTRYGNVMCSRGSVIPLFIEQIYAGLPLTVTDPIMTRYIMSLAEAVDLVMYAFEHANNGDLMIQKAPSCSIWELAQAVREVFHSSTEIRVVGTRHGEKRYEVLMTKEEAAKSIDLGKYYRIPADNRELRYDKYLVEGSDAITKAQEYNSENTRILSREEIIEKLLSLEYVRNAIDRLESRR